MMRTYALAAALLGCAAVWSGSAVAGNTPAMQPAPQEDYVPSLITDTPLQGRQLAITLVRKTIGSIQRDDDAKRRVREKYEEDPEMLMQAAAMVTAEFRIIAEANNYWRDPRPGSPPGD
ncbi:hexameric tyrosine-coordinated heme protein [Luteimonas qiangzhengi]|uniref:hexameric tyrosine-coordinated heme protein n=1 Tax=Luteimonas sp. MJ146 TaxID=3129240 RepID=UPI0031BBABD4